MWVRKLDEPEPSARVHTFSRPPVLEALQLLPVAARVGSYIHTERQAGREPIFDLNGILLEPPTPGPYAGVPLGGIGSGCIGRGYRGEMRRWSVHAGRYIHREVLANQFSVRIQRGGAGGAAQTVVLSVMDGTAADPLLRGWAWGVPAARVESRALFPRSWLLFREPVPGVNVTIEQLSPVLPHCYSDTSLPTCVFTVTVEDLAAATTTTTTTTDTATTTTFITPTHISAVSVMMTMQNSDGTVDDAAGGYAHAPFSISPEGEGAGEGEADTAATGVCMARHRRVPAAAGAGAGGSSSTCADQGSMSLAALTRAGDGGAVSVCGMFSTAVTAAAVAAAAGGTTAGAAAGPAAALSDAAQLWAAFSATGGVGACGGARGVSPPGVAVAGAVCLQRAWGSGGGGGGGGGKGKGSEDFVFALSWDHPVARFGHHRALPKYYTRFFGRSGLASPSIAAYSLSQQARWRQGIADWQHPVNSDASLPEYYRHMLFNELYFLVDGGSVWLDTSDGVDNAAPVPAPAPTATEGEAEAVTATEAGVGTGAAAVAVAACPCGLAALEQALRAQETARGAGAGTAGAGPWAAHDEAARGSQGASSAVGQFLYLEGHEYLM
jgi:non-lysosomal glucosylceramidase